MQQVADWLEKLGLGQYAQRFAENHINFSILPDLTDQDLEKIGAASLGYRRLLLRDIAEYNLERKRRSSTSSAGLPKRRAADTYRCYASRPGPSWPCMSLNRYTQFTLNVARHAKKGEVEGEIKSQIEYQGVQEGQASSAAQAAEAWCQHSGARGCCNESSRLRRQARSRRSGVKRRRGATSF
jgi:hypothetical protein